MHRRRLHLLFTIFLVACGSWAQDAPAPHSLPPVDKAVTAVQGESWLVHLNRPFGDTSMGKTGRLGPPPAQGNPTYHPATPVQFQSADKTVTLGGADLYRMNCQGCHGETGAGAPPEINSVINPVRATSAPLVMQRMKERGMEMGRAEAAKLAQQANAALLKRLHEGGENMPAFAHLDQREVRSLLAYLKQLAGIPGAEREQAAVKEPAARVGELIAKSTCHTCHSATGPDPGPQQLLQGAIPPLSTLTERKREADFIGKVTQGAPVMMGEPPLLYRGRMPAFYYLSEEEAADVYLYLTLYPPSEKRASAPVLAALQQGPPSAPGGPGAPAPPATATDGGIRTQANAGEVAEVLAIALPWTAAVVGLMLAGGLVFTWREFRRLSARRPIGPRLVSTAGAGRPLGAMTAGSFSPLCGRVRRSS